MSEVQTHGRSGVEFAPRSDVDELAAVIAALSPPAKLRLAADLLEKRRPRLAHSLVERVSVELGAALALARTEPPR